MIFAGTLYFLLIFRDAFCDTISTCEDGCRHVNLFRRDFIYLSDGGGYFKVHNAPTTWEAARTLCRLEGAQLASPHTEEVKEAMKFFTAQLFGHKVIYTGFTSKFLPGRYISYPGNRLDGVPHNWAVSEPHRFRDRHNALVMDEMADLSIVNMDEQYPFICFQNENPTTFLNECGVSDKQYKFAEQLKACYKFHVVAQPWQYAVATCSGEGGHLVIINSDEEAAHIKDVINKHSKEIVGTYIEKNRIYNGFYRNVTTNEWLTIKDQSIEETGYSKWDQDEPVLKETFNCGSLSLQLELYSVECHVRRVFICEMIEPQTPTQKSEYIFIDN